MTFIKEKMKNKINNQIDLERKSLRYLEIGKKVAGVGLSFSLIVGGFCLPKYINSFFQDTYNISTEEEISMVEMGKIYEQMCEQKSVADGVILTLLSGFFFGGGYHWMSKEIEDKKKGNRNTSRRDLENKL